jgi:hypothetical protein
MLVFEYMPKENRIFETLPSARLAGLLDQAAGPGKRYVGLNDGETVAAARPWPRRDGGTRWDRGPPRKC